MKSAGWLKRMAHLPSIQSCQWISPWVVMAVKSGTMLPRRSTCRQQAVRGNAHSSQAWRVHKCECLCEQPLQDT